MANGAFCDLMETNGYLDRLSSIRRWISEYRAPVGQNIYIGAVERLLPRLSEPPFVQPVPECFFSYFRQGHVCLDRGVLDAAA